MPISIDNNYPNADHARIAYNTGSAEPVREGSVSSARAANAGLNAGTTVTGEIVEKDGDQVTIRMANDKTISARLSGNANIEVGMKMTFEVAKGSGDQLALRPLYSNLSNSNAAMSALRAAGLPVNETTLAMTDRMMTESMAVNRNALTEMFRNVSAHSNVSPESIVQMTKLNMPLTESNVIQFDNYRSFEHQITNDLQTVSQSVADLFGEAANTLGSDAGMFGNMTPGEVINEVLNLIDPDSLETIMPENIRSAATTAQAETVVQTVVIPEAAVSESSSEAAETAIAEEGAEEAAPAMPEQGAVNPEGIQGAVRSTVDGFISGLKEMFTSSTPAETADSEAIFNANLSLTSSEQMALSQDLQNLMLLAGESADIHQPLDPSQIMSAVRELVNEYPPDDVTVMPAELEAYSEEGSESSDEAKLLSAAQSDIDSLKKEDGQPEVSAESIKAKITEKLGELLKSDGFNKLVKDSVKARMSIKPQDVAQNGKIDELYDRIQKTSARITQLMENIGRADSAAARSAGALSDNVNFMNNLNEFVNYIQLPLKMAGEDANGELYVYTNKKNLADNDGNYSALLHLDMEHLGPMDIYVTMRDHTKVNTNFYLQTEELLDFVAAHIDQLTKRLAEKGYDTNMKFTKKEPGEAIKPIADEFTKEDATSENRMVVSRMRFDVRA